MADLSLVIVTVNNIDLTGSCLHSAYEHAGGLEIETIVVCNRARDSVAQRLRNEFKRTKVIATEANLGYGGAANLGLAAARGRHLGVLNDDTELREGALPALVAFLDGHPRAGLAGPRLTYPDGRLQPSTFRFPNLGASLVRHLVPRRAMQSAAVTGVLRSVSKRFRIDLGNFSSEVDVTRRIDFPMGAALFLPREVYEQVGGFDADFFMFAEEADWAKRISDAGWQVFHVAEATVVHRGSPTAHLVRHRYLIQQYKSLLRFYEKHYSPVRVGAYKALMAALLGSRALAYLLGAGLSGRRRDAWMLQWEAYATAARVMVDPSLRSQDVFADMAFRHIAPVNL